MVSSIGVDFKTKDIMIDNKKVKLQIWDTAGHERFRTITTSYYRGAHGIATVFDLTERDTFEHVEKWLEEINKFAKENVMRFLIGNKSDLVDKRKVSYEEVRVLANKLNIYYVETSAKNNINISDFFRVATQDYLNKYDFNIEKEKGGVALDSRQLNNKRKKTGGCC
jgi:Ras-related protein Rab-1A